MHPGIVVAVVFASLILAVSFFTLLALEKTESQPLKTFGKVVAVLLWVSALAVLLGGTLRPCGKGRFDRHPGEGRACFERFQDRQAPPSFDRREERRGWGKDGDRPRFHGERAPKTDAPPAEK